MFVDAVDGGGGGRVKKLDARAIGKGRGGGKRVGDGMAFASENEVVDCVGAGDKGKTADGSEERGNKDRFMHVDVPPGEWINGTVSGSAALG